MLDECLSALNIKESGTYVDVTYGGGGHSAAILEKLSEKGKLIGFDQDKDALSNLPKDDRFSFVHHNYRFLTNFLKYEKAIPVDGILADLGISGHQIDEGSRGFSYRFDAPLDMRMDEGMEVSAKEIVNEYSAEALEKVFSVYGELQRSRAIAAAIVKERRLKPIETTFELMEVLKSFAPAMKDFRFWSQVFQALRIEVNKELEALKEFLLQTSDVIRSGGRLVVLTYHSLEDRLVKQFIQHGSFGKEPETDLYGKRDLPFTAVNRKPLEPDEEEIAANPRARSAKLRVAERK
jgi:16S rRNA (cytosine1402-N4)-methyltransferase